MFGKIHTLWLTFRLFHQKRRVHFKTDKNSLSLPTLRNTKMEYCVQGHHLNLTSRCVFFYRCMPLVDTTVSHDSAALNATTLSQTAGQKWHPWRRLSARQPSSAVSINCLWLEEDPMTTHAQIRFVEESDAWFWGVGCLWNHPVVISACHCVFTACKHDIYFWVTLPGCDMLCFPV